MPRRYWFWQRAGLNSILLATLLIAMAHPSFSQEIKEADLAGSWYPGSKAALQAMLDGYLKQSEPEKVEGDILAIISPHAGYQFSGPVAAYGFNAVKDRGFKTAIVLGFSHRQHFEGISIYDRGSFRTPLGDITIDEVLAKEIISKNKRLRFEKTIFEGENSVEMQIPFIQAALKDVKIVPIAFGTQNYEDAEILAQALASVLKNRKDILLVASTDLSHYHPYAEANSIDKHTIGALKGLKAKEFYKDGTVGVCELCGLMSVTAALLTAEKLGFSKFKVLKYANSGDTFGDKSRVVGYLSAVVYREQKTENRKQITKNREQRTENEGSILNDAERKRLLEIARESIIGYVREGKRKKFQESDPVLNKPMGAFVTLHEKDELRGCIGNMVGRGPLYQTVADMAIESATGDPRFSALSPAEIDKVDIEISVLSEMKKVKSADDVKIPGHGVMVKKGARGGVFLPQVADETGWSKEEFLSNLCSHKAGLPPDAWKDPKADIYIFTAEVFSE